MVKRTETAKYLYIYYTRQLKALKKDLGKAGSSPEKDAIHRLRVDIKKLKTLYKLLETLFPANFDAEKYLALTGKIFKNAGRVREVQLNKEQISQYRISPPLLESYLKYLDTEEWDARSTLIKTIKHFNTRKLNVYKEYIEDQCQTITRKTFDERSIYFIHDKAGKIKKLKPLTAANLHKIRKHLKELSAVTQLLYKMEPGRFNSSFVTELKETGTLIGEWHDRTVLITSLQNFLTDTVDLPRAGTMAIKRLISAIRRQNQWQTVMLQKKTGILVKNIP